MFKINGKPLEFVASAGFHAKYGGFESVTYINIARQVLQNYPVDMLVFEMRGTDHLQVRLAGHNLKTGVLDEKTIAHICKSLPIDKFWLKIDDYEDKYIGTFLFPEEY